MKPEDDIDLIEMLRFFKTYKRLIIRISVIFSLTGLIIGLGSKVEYVSFCKLMPESQEGLQSDMGGLGGLVGLAGINLNMSDKNALTPDVYPQIASSIPFLLKIWNEQIHFEKQDTLTTPYIFFKEIDRPSFIGYFYQYTVGLPFQILKWSSNKNKETIKFEEITEDKIIKLSKFDSKLLERFKSRITVTVDSKSGIITISSEMPDAQASAEIVSQSLELLTEYVTDYKISKAQENLDFIQARYNESKEDFINSQEQLALFNDRNLNVVTAVAQTEQQRLQNEYNIAFEIFKGLATQLEQAKIKVKEETPVFIVLEPVQKPVKKNKPKRLYLLIGFTLFGIFIGLFTVILKYFYIKFKNKW